MRMTTVVSLEASLGASLVMVSDAGGGAAFGAEAAASDPDAAVSAAVLPSGLVLTELVEPVVLAELGDTGLVFLFINCPLRLIGVFLGKALPYPLVGGFWKLTWAWAGRLRRVNVLSAVFVLVFGCHGIFQFRYVNPYSSRIKTSQVRRSASHRREPSGPLRVSTRAPLRNWVAPRTRKLLCSVSTCVLTPQPLTNVILWTAPWGVTTEFMPQLPRPWSSINMAMITKVSSKMINSQGITFPLAPGVSGDLAPEAAGVGR